MDNLLNITYASSLTDLCEVNSSFDKGVISICYPGLNRNKSFIEKSVLERCAQTLYGVPVVCNYDVETDTIGGHDMDVVKDDAGNLKLINCTTPVGCVVPQSNVWFDTITEEDGTEREYLFAEVLLWKRQSAYQKIKEDGFEAQSMELTVKDGELKDGIYYINDLSSMLSAF